MRDNKGSTPGDKLDIKTTPPAIKRSRDWRQAIAFCAKATPSAHVPYRMTAPPKYVAAKTVAHVLLPPGSVERGIFKVKPYFFTSFSYKTQDDWKCKSCGALLTETTTCTREELVKAFTTLEADLEELVTAAAGLDALALLPFTGDAVASGPMIRFEPSTRPRILALQARAEEAARRMRWGIKYLARYLAYLGRKEEEDLHPGFWVAYPDKLDAETVRFPPEPLGWRSIPVLDDYAFRAAKIVNASPESPREVTELRLEIVAFAMEMVTGKGYEAGVVWEFLPRHGLSHEDDGPEALMDAPPPYSS